VKREGEREREKERKKETERRNTPILAFAVPNAYTALIRKCDVVVTEVE